MMLYVSPDRVNAGNPVYETPYPEALFLGPDGESIVRLYPDRHRLHLPMVERWDATWDGLFSKLLPLVTARPGDVALVYRSLTALGGGTLHRPEVVRQIEVGVMYEVPELPSPEWTRFSDLAAWWAQLGLDEIDRRIEEALARVGRPTA